MLCHAILVALSDARALLLMPCWPYVSGIGVIFQLLGSPVSLCESALKKANTALCREQYMFLQAHAPASWLSELRTMLAARGIAALLLL